jgi:myo-inositol-1(or 4)-monophosphatase
MKETVAYAKNIVLEAGELLRNALGQEVCCSYKNNDHRDLLTEDDGRIEDFIITNIKSKYPDHKFIAEERENNDDLAGYVWILDPIDGTTNFVCLQKNFAISLALYQDGCPIFGMVYDVMSQDTYLGLAGQGAYLNGQKINKLAAVCLKNCILDVSLNSVEALYNNNGIKIFDLAKEIRGHRSSGVASLAICRIALGEIHIFISAKLKAWDFAAAGIILNEVGGYYHSIFAKEVDLTGKPITFMACASKETYDQICNLCFASHFSSNSCSRF